MADAREKTPLLGDKIPEKCKETRTGEENRDVQNTEEVEVSDEHSRAICACVPIDCLNVFLAFLTLSTLVFKTIALPAYTSAVTNSGSDPFSVALIAGFWFQWFFLLVAMVYKVFIDSSMNLLPTTEWKIMLLIGFLNGMAGIPLVFASDPKRTPPYLQSLLSTLVIPYTVIFRFLILRKGMCFFHKLYQLCTIKNNSNSVGVYMLNVHVLTLILIHIFTAHQ